MKRILLSVFAFSSLMVNAQIVYTDVNPDVTLGMDQMYLLDVDNDNNDDYIIEQVDSMVSGNPLEGVQLRSIGTINEAIYEVTTLTMLKGHALNDVIDMNQNWTVPSPSLPGGGVITIGGNDIPAGDWADGLDHYAGLHFDQGGNKYYGWVRFSMTTDGLSFTIKDYAYHMGKDHPLLAGATVDAVDENSISNFKFISFSNLVSVQNLNANFDVNIYDLGGRLIFSDQVNTQFSKDFSSFDSGIYIIRCYNEKESAEFKFSVNK